MIDAGGVYLSLLVNPLHRSRGEEGQDESEGADQVAREGVDQRQLLKHQSRTMKACKQNHCLCVCVCVRVCVHACACVRACKLTKLSLVSQPPLTFCVKEDLRIRLDNYNTISSSNRLHILDENVGPAISEVLPVNTVKQLYPPILHILHMYRATACMFHFRMANSNSIASFVGPSVRFFTN